MRDTDMHVKKWWQGEGVKKSVFFRALLFVGLFLGVGISSSGNLFCQNFGLKYYRNFSPDEYVYQPQNWCILQDRRGVIYVANNGGVMEYDGVSWRLIKIPSQTVRSLAIDEIGVIYVGGIDELGFLLANSTGIMEYRSLLEYIDKDKKSFGDVWRIHSTKEGIFFRTSKYIFRWIAQRRQMDTLLETPKGGKSFFNASFSCKGKYFLNQRSNGLMEFTNNAFKIIRGGETFAFATIGRIFMIAPYETSGGNLLIGTEKKGFFIHDGTELKSFPTEVDDYLREKQAYHGIVLSGPGRDFAIATLHGGLAVIDRQGKLKYRFTKELGLYDNSTKYVFEDYQGNLWIALENGISRIEYSSLLSVFNDNSGLVGMVLSVTRNSTGLYAGTTRGLFHLEPDSNKFKPIPDVTGSCWSLLSSGDSILVASDSGVYQVKNNITRRITADTSLVLFHSRKHTGRIWVGMLNTLGSLVLNPTPGESWQSKWVEGPRFEKINKQVRTIVEDQDGNLWLGVRPAGVFKVTFPIKDNINNYETKFYDTSFKLPQDEVQVLWAADHVMFGTKETLLRFHQEKQRFIPDITLGKEFSTILFDVYRVQEDSDGVIWFHARGRNYLAVPQPDGRFEIDEKSLARIPVAAQVNCIYRDPQEDVTWFATHRGLIRYEAGVKKNYDNEYNTIIRHTAVNGTPRFYNLYSSGPTLLLDRVNEQTIPCFSYNDRNLRFEFYAPFFEDEARMTYSYKLEGYEDQWTHRHKEGFKEYTNLDAGLYTFRVKAKNVYGTFGREASFKFKIQPPWYLAWWAFLSYVLLFFLVLFLTVKWRSSKLRQEKKRLEQVVEQRTKEINLKNQQLEKQTHLLIEQAEKLKELDHAKSRFFANISHEFRTPLTLILGPLEQILSKRLPDPFRNKLNLMHRNSHRLLTLINRLLDLSRIDSGKMKLRAARQDIISFLKGIVASFEHQAKENKLTLEFHPHQTSIYLYFDREKLEEVFTNLISNAVKFTPPKGKITVSVKRLQEKEEDFPAGSLEVLVQDTGIGIPRQLLAHIFDRFFQVESHERKHKGSGIGLALTRELVLLHHGRIDVSSQVGENSGTEFILRFPLGKAHLKPEEIIDTLEKEPELPYKKQDIPQDIDSKTNIAEEGFEDTFVETEESKKEVTPGKKEQQAGKHTILVVEDSPGMRQFIGDSIKADYTVVEAEDGQEGWQKARDLMPDLIVSDIMMPKMDGYELCQKLKTDIKTSHIPVIILTAKASEASKLQGLEIGADDYIIKPFNMKILVTRIKNLIDLRRQLQEKIQRQLLLQPEEIKVSPIDKKLITRLHEILEKHIADEDLNVESLSEKMDISRVTLNKKIQALTGETATEFIRSYRLKRAMQLLRDNFGSVLEVSLEVGFSNPSYFARCFKEKFHQLPSEFLGRKA